MLSTNLPGPMANSADLFEFWLTVAVLALGVAATGFLSWLERRPRTTLTPRLIPTTPLMLISGFIALLALVHLVNLYGITTGNQTRP